MSTTIESLTSRADERREQAEAGYDALVGKLTVGEQPALPEAEKVLAAVGRTPQDLAAEVARRQRILALEATIAEQNATIEKATSEMEHLAAERDSLEKAYLDAYRTFGSSTNAFTQANASRRFAQGRRSAAQQELTTLRGGLRGRS